MNFGVVCPVCKGRLRVDNNSILCRSCALEFPVIKGIADLHYPPSILSQVDISMLSHFDQFSFDKLISILLEDVKLSDNIIQDTITYYKEQIERVDRMTNMFLEKLTHSFCKPIQTRALDLGCGSGAGIFSLSNIFDQVIGVDASMAQLLLAKKILEDSSFDNFLLLRSNAKNLPFPDNTLGYIQAINVLEHIMGEQKVVHEVSRCLMDQGSFVADSRNRFDIFYPEPHTGLRFLGFLPRKFIPEYVRFQCNSKYEQTWLLSYKEIKKMMKRNFQGKFMILFPKVQAYGKTGKVDKWLSTIENKPIIKGLLIRVFPTHILLGKKHKTWFGYNNELKI